MKQLGSLSPAAAHRWRADGRTQANSQCDLHREEVTCHRRVMGLPEVLKVWLSWSCFTFEIR